MTPPDPGRPADSMRPAGSVIPGRPAVLIMAKAPRPGVVKTRLHPMLGPDGCAALAEQLIRHTASVAAGVGGVTVFAAVDPPDALGEVSGLVPGSVRLLRQRGTNLGERLATATGEVLGRGHRPVVVVGTDAPTLTGERLTEAFRELARGRGVVFGPACDGGYYLVGLNEPAPGLFALDPAMWGGNRVLAASLAAARRAGLDAGSLSALRDLDTPEDAEALLADPLLPAVIADALQRRPAGRNARRSRESCRPEPSRQGPSRPLPVSIVVPVLNEAGVIGPALAALRRDFPGCELVVADGGSSDGTAGLAAPLAGVVRSDPGRAAQMNAGARQAGGEVLWFIHADTRVDPRALAQIRAALADPAVAGGGLTLRFDIGGPGLRYVAWTSNLRARYLHWVFGDQAMFIRASVFGALGGFPDLPIMEDLEMSRRLHRRGRLVLLPATAITSARRFTEHGTLRTLAFMQYLKALYFLGTDPQRICDRYRSGPRLGGGGFGGSSPRVSTGKEMAVTTADETIGARLDRLRWSRLHTIILVALGAGWLFDSFEVQMFSSAVGPLGDHFHASVFARDALLAVWLSGILLGALAGGRLADRFGRRRLFVITLLWYAGFTVATGLAPGLALVYVFRFLAALGVGAEYAIVNSAIAEFVPARVRGKVNALVMNFWPAGAILAALLAYLILDTLALGSASSWRYMFILGGLIALVVLYFRRRIPESPRWLASRGRQQEAEAIVTALERRAGAGSPPGIRVDGHGPGLREALGELVRHYPGRLALGAVLDLAEAFGYYGLFALLSVVVLAQVHISQQAIPFFYIIGNLGALAGGVAMSGFFDRLGHRVTVGFCYLASAAGVGLLALATATGSGAWVTVAFAVASACGTAAWTSAYPMFTELFPTHLRGAGVGVSVAVGRAGAIVGTLALPAIATSLGATASYLLVVAFWLGGAAAIGVYAAAGGAEPAGRALEAVSPLRLAGVPATAAAEGSGA